LRPRSSGLQRKRQLWGEEFRDSNYGFGSGLAARCLWKLTLAGHAPEARFLFSVPSPMYGIPRGKAAGRHHTGRARLNRRVFRGKVRKLGCG
jgi:hypothetical protein